MQRPRQLHCASVRESIYLEAISCSVTAGIGTPYQISEKDIDATQQFSSHNEYSFVSADRATQELILQNDFRRFPTSRERAAMERLSAGLSNARCSIWHPDLVIKCFFDLDIVFFGGVLRGNVCFDWGDPDLMDTYERTSGEFLGITRSKRPGRGKVFLNARRIFLHSGLGLGLSSDPFRTMFATALHEMCVSTTIVLLRSSFYDLSSKLTPIACFRSCSRQA